MSHIHISNEIKSIKPYVQLILQQIHEYLPCSQTCIKSEHENKVIAHFSGDESGKEFSSCTINKRKFLHSRMVKKLVFKMSNSCL
jgi:hypothetical protein